MIPIFATIFGAIAVLLWRSGLSLTLVVGGTMLSAFALMVTLAS